MKSSAFPGNPMRILYVFPKKEGDSLDKERLFQFMRVRFHEAGFTSGEIDIHIARFADRYASMSDEEIENDLRAHGGTAKIVSHVIEYRNSTLMKEPDYRAFVEGVKNAPEMEETKETEPEAVTPAFPAASQEPQPEEPAAVSSPADIAEEDDEDDVKTYIPGQAARTADHTAAPAAKEQPQSEPSAESPVPQQKTEVPELSGVPQKTPSDRQQNENAQNENVWGVDEWRSLLSSVQPAKPSAPERPDNRDQSLDEELLSALNAATQPQKQERPAAAQEPAAQNPPRPEPVRPEPVRQEPIRQEQSAQENDMSRTKVIPAAKPQHRNQPPVHEEHRERREEKSYRSRGRVSRLAEKTYWGEATTEGFRRFWILFAVCLPFVILLGLAFLALSAAVIAVLVVGIIALVLALVGEVAVGAAIALVGVIYGISQLFITLPIGLFETGIGVTIIGATIFVGILLYNLAVRFLPFLLRQYIRFMKFLRAYMKDVYYYLKGECYRR